MMQQDMIGVHQYPFSYVIEHYGVPARAGRRITHHGRSGIIVEDHGHYIGVTFDDEKPGTVSSVHPTDGVEYHDIGKIRKISRSQKRYASYLRSETSLTFAEYIGATK